VATAKAIATIDQLLGGRVLFGIGVGWLQTSSRRSSGSGSTTAAR
jgi:alkanesulfonate monooxygenase SsuD/methylene tetrahydromethanopterin reductase-like flavin-dependent oxidoreductase (luciferase family)